VGETVTAKMTVMEIDTDKQRVCLDTECLVDGNTVAIGRAVVWVPKREQYVRSGKPCTFFPLKICSIKKGL